MTSTSPQVLISGAGIAGPTLAWWLARAGWRPTLVERAQGVRSSGNPVDVRGPAFPVATAMGLLPALRAAATRVTARRVFDPAGRPIARIATRTREEIEIPRGDLATALFTAAVAAGTEVLLDDTITALSQDPGGVDVTFARAAPRRFDLVVGADGLHSTTRRLAFGPESGFVRHLGLYVATLPAGDALAGGREVLLHNTPGRLLCLHPARDSPVAAFIFRHPRVGFPGPRGVPERKQLIIDRYAGAGWRTPELLDLVRATDDLYFDSVSLVRLPRWSDGRVTLLGDAASCVSLFGDGSTLAIAGARTLAAALTAHPGDVDAALRAYESRHRPLVARRQRAAGRAAALLIPATRAGLGARNAVARFLR